MTPISFLDGKVILYPGDCREALKLLPDNHVDSVCVDPPYHLTSIVKRFGGKNAARAKHGTDGAFARASAGFMGKQWDGGDIAFQPELWAEVLRVLKPGSHGLAFGGTRTFHRLVCAIEDGGAQIRDCLVWTYGSGLPKSLSVSKQIDKMAGAARMKIKATGSLHKNRLMNDDGWSKIGDDCALMDSHNPATDSAREWDGWGSALKPAVELICLFRKPLSEASIAANVLRWGTGAINVDGCRIEAEPRPKYTYCETGSKRGYDGGIKGSKVSGQKIEGRWPANLCHDGSEEVLACFPETGASSDAPRHNGEFKSVAKGRDLPHTTGGHSDSGSAARFFASFPQDDEPSERRIFYTSKAGNLDRCGSSHPTVKPIALIQYLTRLITPPGGIVLDLFAGSGTTGEAAFREGFRTVLIEREPEYIKDIERRMGLVMAGPDERSNASIKARGLLRDDGPLFGGKEKVINDGLQIYGVFEDELIEDRPKRRKEPLPNCQTDESKQIDLLDVKIKLAEIAVEFGCDIEVKLTNPLAGDAE